LDRTNKTSLFHVQRRIRYHSPMLTLQQCRELDPRLQTVPDDVLERFRDDLYEMARLAHIAWKLERVGSNRSPEGSCSEIRDGGTM
jgi:hypothetical protein